jgi:nicotinamide phosphoribosyltransferase
VVAFGVPAHRPSIRNALWPAGILAVKRVDGVPVVFPASTGEVAAEENLLKVVYDCGPVEGVDWGTFDEVRERVKLQWPALPKTAVNMSASLRAKVVKEMAAKGKTPA